VSFSIFIKLFYFDILFCSYGTGYHSVYQELKIDVVKSKPAEEVGGEDEENIQYSIGGGKQDN